MPFPPRRPDLANALIRMVADAPGGTIHTRSSGLFDLLADEFGLNEEERTETYGEGKAQKNKWDQGIRVLYGELKREGLFRDGTAYGEWALSEAGMKLGEALLDQWAEGDPSGETSEMPALDPASGEGEPTPPTAPEPVALPAPPQPATTKRALEAAGLLDLQRLGFDVHSQGERVFHARRRLPGGRIELRVRFVDHESARRLSLEEQEGIPWLLVTDEEVVVAAGPSVFSLRASRLSALADAHQTLPIGVDRLLSLLEEVRSSGDEVVDLFLSQRLRSTSVSRILGLLQAGVFEVLPQVADALHEQIRIEGEVEGPQGFHAESVLWYLRGKTPGCRLALAEVEAALDLLASDAIEWLRVDGSRYLATLSSEEAQRKLMALKLLE